MGKIKGIDREIYIRDKCKCQFCDFKGTELGKWRQLELCCLIPPIKGGRRTKDNLVVTCHRCRQLKNQFNPRTEPGSDKSRIALINATKEYIRKRPDSIDESEDFETMMREINAA